MASKLNLLFCAAIAFAQPKPPAARVADFESTAFCRKYHCRLTGAPEPLRYAGVVEEFFYNYRVSGSPAQFGLRLTTDVKRASPFLIVRWVKTYSMHEPEAAGVSELVREVTGEENFDAAKFVERFSESRPQAGAGPSGRVGRFKVYCTWTPPKDPQITLIIEEMSIGTATMAADGTIVLRLRAEGRGGALGDGELRYPNTHPEYKKILDHLRGLKPGETKAVPPWPEDR